MASEIPDGEKSISAPKLKTSTLPTNIKNLGGLNIWSRKIIPLWDMGGLTVEDLEKQTQNLIAEGILWTDGKVIVSE